jgi:L-2-hydroxyglutarate oxidase LhgO
MAAFCARRGVPYLRCGKLVVATEPGELPGLAELERRAGANGVPGIARVDAAAMREIEPNVRGIAALHSPDTAIVDYRRVAAELAASVREAGGALRFDTEVARIEEGGEGATVHLVGGERIEADRVLVCAGLEADVLASASGRPGAPRIIPFRGEYWQLASGREDLVRGLIYPVPDPDLPFLGVHLTKRVDGAVLIGPNAVFALAREGYRWRDVDLRGLAATLRWPGTRRLFAANWRTGVDEVARSLSKTLFVRAARRYLRGIETADVVRAPAGVRAQAVDADGSLVDDFRIESSGATSWVRNAPSPAATSSLAIAEVLVERLGLAAA